MPNCHVKKMVLFGTKTKVFIYNFQIKFRFLALCVLPKHSLSLSFLILSPSGMTHSWLQRFCRPRESLAKQPATYLLQGRCTALLPHAANGQCRRAPTASTRGRSKGQAFQVTVGKIYSHNVTDTNWSYILKPHLVLSKFIEFQGESLQCQEMSWKSCVDHRPWIFSRLLF